MKSRMRELASNDRRKSFSRQNEQLVLKFVLVLKYKPAYNSAIYSQTLCLMKGRILLILYQVFLDRTTMPI